MKIFVKYYRVLTLSKKKFQQRFFLLNSAKFPITPFLKSDSHLPKKICFICLNESPLKMMKNAFYFILKALFVLKIFKFLS